MKVSTLSQVEYLQDQAPLKYLIISTLFYLHFLPGNDIKNFNQFFEDLNENEGVDTNCEIDGIFFMKRLETPTIPKCNKNLETERKFKYKQR